jgi:tetratricopeptide (TPR) repeat protein
MEGVGSGRRPWWPALALVTLLALAYAPLPWNGFLPVDDGEYLTANPVVARGLTADGIRWAFTAVGYASNWHPLTWLSHMLDVSLFGMDPRGHHLVNLLLHALAALLFCNLLRAATGRPGASLAAALLFALHPLRVESVAWAAERKDVLAGLLFLATLRLWLRHLARPSPPRYLAAVACAAASLLAKPTGVTLPFALLLLDHWPLGRLGGPAGGERGTVRGLASLVTEKIPFFLLAALSSWVTLVAQTRGLGIKNAPLDLRLANALVSWVRYLDKTFVPMDLAFFYPVVRLRLGDNRVWLSALLLAAVTLAALLVRRGYPAVGWLWFLGTLVPVIGLVQVGQQAMADRYTYLPSLGLAILLVWGVSDLLGRLHLPRLAGPLLLLAATVPLLVLTPLQVRRWRDFPTLAAHTLRVTRDNWLAESWLGDIRYREGRTDEALAHFNRSAALMPGYAPTQMNLGLIYLQRGERERADHHFREAARLGRR